MKIGRQKQIWKGCERGIRGTFWDAEHFAKNATTNYISIKKAPDFSEASVIPAGLEPATHSLEGYCSIQLSYETITLLRVQI